MGGVLLLTAALLLIAPASVGAQETGAQEPLTLDTAIQRALAHNYTIKVESFTVPMAQAGVREAYGRYDPQLFLSYNDRTNNQPSGFDPSTGEAYAPSVFDQTTYTAGVSGELPLGITYEVGGSSINSRGDYPDDDLDFDQFGSGVGATVRVPILRGFGTSATLTTIRIARTDLSISEWDFRATVINTVTRVISAFNELLFAQANLRSARRSRELANGLYEENERRHQVGSMSEYDVLSARARVATREEGILHAERFVREAENFLKQLISDDRTAALLSASLQLVPPAPPAEVVVDVNTDVPLALAQRPDFQQARLALQRQDYNYRFQRNQLLPSVQLVGSYGYNGSGSDFATSRREITDRTFPDYTAGITVSVPLTSTAERARYRTARLARERAETGLQQLEQDIVVNLGNAAGQIGTTWKRVLATRASRDLSQQALDAEVKKLRAGTGSTFIVLQLQEILSTDEVREARAVADYRNALAEYDRQLGRTLTTHHIDLSSTP